MRKTDSRAGAALHSPNEVRCSKRAASILRPREDEFAALITLGMGKLIRKSRGEVVLSADIIDYYAQPAEAFLAPKPLSPQQGEATVESSPIGVLFGIELWNLPYYQLARIVAPNLMAGNVVMVKHAPSAPQCVLAFVALFKEADAPEGAYSNPFLSDAAADQLIDDRIQEKPLSLQAGRMRTLAPRIQHDIRSL